MQALARRTHYRPKEAKETFQRPRLWKCPESEKTTPLFLSLKVPAWPQREAVQECGPSEGWPAQGRLVGRQSRWSPVSSDAGPLGALGRATLFSFHA